MSKIYDDLGTVEGGRRRQKDVGELELFAYAAARKRESEPAPPASEEPKPSVLADGGAPLPDRQPGAEQSAETQVVAGPSTAPHLQRNAPRRNQPIYSSTLSPILGVRPMKGHWSRRDILMAAVVVLLALVAVGFFIGGVVGAVSRAAARRRQAGSSARAEAVAAAQPRVEAPAARPAAARPVAQPAPARPAAQAATVKPVASVPPLKLSVPGATVKADGGETVVFFDSGVFSSATRLSPEGRAALIEAGRQILRLGKPVTVTVVGCTDNVPVTRKSAFKDNTDLGLQRAGEAIKVLQAAGVPASSLKPVSYGVQWSPYPNDTPQNRARNRTVVLRMPST